MCCCDFVVPVCAYQQHVPRVRMVQQMFEQIECGRVEPLQIIEEKRKRMLRPGKHSQESTKNELEPSLRVLRRQLRDRTLFADDELQLRDQVHHKLPIRTECLVERLTPAAKLGVVLGQERADQALKCLR